MNKLYDFLYCSIVISFYWLAYIYFILDINIINDYKKILTLYLSGMILYWIGYFTK